MKSNARRTDRSPLLISPQCPANSVSMSQGFGTTEGCSCDPGYFKLGEDCIECPEGGVCDGGADTIPFPQPGYYGNPSDGGIEFLDCGDEDQCPGGRNFACGEEWAKKACAMPNDGYMLVGPRPVKCPTTNLHKSMMTVAAFSMRFAVYVSQSLTF